MKKMPQIGLGTFISIEQSAPGYIQNVHERFTKTTETILSAFRLGYRHLDLAECYGNLAAVKMALKLAFDEGLLKRADLWITIKANVYPMKPRLTSQRMDELLNAVGVEYFDLFLIHHPTVGDLFDNEESLTRCWSDLNALTGEEKKIRCIGVSNFYESHLNRLLAICEKHDFIKPYANEIEVNMFSKEKELVDFCRGNNIKVIAYSPLGYTMVSALSSIYPDIPRLAAEVKVSEIQLILTWLMAQDITVIPKSTSKAHLLENIHSLDHLPRIKAMPALIQELNDQYDIGPATTTPEENKRHGESLTWDVAPTPPAMRHSF